MRGGLVENLRYTQFAHFIVRVLELTLACTRSLKRYRLNYLQGKKTTTVCSVNVDIFVEVENGSCGTTCEAGELR